MKKCNALIVIIILFMLWLLLVTKKYSDLYYEANWKYLMCKYPYTN